MASEYTYAFDVDAAAGSSRFRQEKDFTSKDFSRRPNILHRKSASTNTTSSQYQILEASSSRASLDEGASSGTSHHLQERYREDRRYPPSAFMGNGRNGSMWTLGRLRSWRGKKPEDSSDVQASRKRDEHLEKVEKVEHRIWEKMEGSSRPKGPVSPKLTPSSPDIPLHAPPSPLPPPVTSTILLAPSSTSSPLKDFNPSTHPTTTRQVVFPDRSSSLTPTPSERSMPSTVAESHTSSTAMLIGQAPRTRLASHSGHTSSLHRKLVKKRPVSGSYHLAEVEDGIRGEGLVTHRSMSMRNMGNKSRLSESITHHRPISKQPSPSLDRQSSTSTTASSSRDILTEESAIIVTPTLIRTPTRTRRPSTEKSRNIPIEPMRLATTSTSPKITPSSTVSSQRTIRALTSPITPVETDDFGRRIPRLSPESSIRPSLPVKDFRRFLDDGPSHHPRSSSTHRTRPNQGPENHRTRAHSMQPVQSRHEHNHIPTSQSDPHRSLSGIAEIGIAERTVVSQAHMVQLPQSPQSPRKHHESILQTSPSLHTNGHTPRRKVSHRNRSKSMDVRFTSQHTPRSEFTIPKRHPPPPPHLSIPPSTKTYDSLGGLDPPTSPNTTKISTPGDKRTSIGKLWRRISYGPDKEIIDLTPSNTDRRQENIPPVPPSPLRSRKYSLPPSNRIHQSPQPLSPIVTPSINRHAQGRYHGPPDSPIRTHSRAASSTRSRSSVKTISRKPVPFFTGLDDDIPTSEPPTTTDPENMTAGTPKAHQDDSEELTVESPIALTSPAFVDIPKRNSSRHHSHQPINTSTANHYATPLGPFTPPSQSTLDNYFNTQIPSSSSTGALARLKHAAKTHAEATFALHETRRKYRQTLVEIQDDNIFQAVLEDISAQDALISRNHLPQSPVGEVVDPMNSVSGDSVNGMRLRKARSDGMQAWFISREIVQGERRYGRLLAKGVAIANDASRSLSVVIPPVPSIDSSTDNHFVKQISPIKSLSRPKSLQGKPRHATIHSTISMPSPTRTFSGFPFPNPPSPPTPIETIRTHLPRLLALSMTLSSRFEHDPSPYGLAESFIALEAELLKEFGVWSSLVGNLVAMGFGRILDEDHLRNSNKRSMSTGDVKGLAAVEGRDEERLGLGDIIIMPIQRASRYKLLFQELLTKLPLQSNTYLKVEQALHTADRIGEECDLRQDFDLQAIRRNGSTTSSGTSTTGSVGKKKKSRPKSMVTGGRISWVSNE